MPLSADELVGAAWGLLIPPTSAAGSPIDSNGSPEAAAAVGAYPTNAVNARIQEKTHAPYADGLYATNATRRSNTSASTPR